MRIKVTRLRCSTGTGSTVFYYKGRIISNEKVEDVELYAPMEDQQSWWDVPLPQCPDCSGDLVWFEAGYVPGARRCMGKALSDGSYFENGGCGSMFSVTTDRQEEG